MTSRPKTRQSVAKAWLTLSCHLTLKNCYPERSEGSAVGRYPFPNCHPERSEGSAVGIRLLEAVSRLARLSPSSLRLLPVAIAIILIAYVLLPVQAEACSVAPRPGYFHQVTSIHGRVVGRSLGPLQFRWLRQSFAVSNATLTLYEYPWSAATKDLKRIAQVNSNSKGTFDFGSVPEGYYSLSVSAKGSDSLGGWFPAEVTNKVGRTVEILLDVSPIHPDCTGGQEFIERKAKDATSN